MKHALRFSFILMGFVLLLFGGQRIESAELNPQSLHKSLLIAGGDRFVDNGDGTLTDNMRGLMWQQGDNGIEVTFEDAQVYCKSLRLGGYADWRLPNPHEKETAVDVKLLMTKHSRDIYANFDLYWSSDSSILLPFNYHPSRGSAVSRVYPSAGGDRAFVRAVRSLRGTKRVSDG